MAEQKTIHLSDEKITKISIPESLADFIIDYLPLVTTFTKEISELKFNPTELSKVNYQKALKELGKHVIENYSETLRFYRYSGEMLAFFVDIKQESKRIKEQERNKLSAKDEISKICQRHYKPLDSQSTSGTH
jgi:hypothetical protein